MFWRVLVAVFSFSCRFVCDYLDITNDKSKLVLVAAVVACLKFGERRTRSLSAQAEICEPKLDLKLSARLLFGHVSQLCLEAGSLE